MISQFLAGRNEWLRACPALADEVYKMVRHCATLNQDRIAMFGEDDAMGRAGLAAVNQSFLG